MDFGAIQLAISKIRIKGCLIYTCTIGAGLAIHSDGIPKIV
jgi:hypothetical protein